MYYVGVDADRKFNVPGFWPDPETTNKIPKEPHEIKAELARMKRESMEKRKQLEEKLAKEYGIDIEEERAKLQK
jgi:protein PET100